MVVSGHGGLALGVRWLQLSSCMHEHWHMTVFAACGFVFAACGSVFAACGCGLVALLAIARSQCQAELRIEIPLTVPKLPFTVSCPTARHWPLLTLLTLLLTVCVFPFQVVL